MVNGHAQKKRIKALFKPTAREVPAKTRLFLFVRAAGRCEFDGCNRYLLEHHLTKVDGIFAQMAHIWAGRVRASAVARPDLFRPGLFAGLSDHGLLE